MYSASGALRGIAIADVDVDSRVDIVDAGAQGVGVEVRYGRGDGTFEPPAIAEHDSLRNVYVADFDQDDSRDILTLGGPLTPLDVFWGIGGRQFTLQTYPLAGGGADFAAIGDVDGDLFVDVVVIENLGALRVHRQNPGAPKLSTGRFVSVGGPMIVPNATEGRSVSLADVNSDSKLDIVALVRGGGDRVAVLLGNGNGTFNAPYTFDVGPTSLALALADLDGSGDVDAITANRDSLNAQDISVLLNVGGGLFQSPSP